MTFPTPPTIYDVADKAEVSIGTVSNYLNNKMKKDSKTYKKIQAAIDELGYIPYGNTGSKGRRQIGRIGVLSPFQLTPSFSLRLQGIIQVTSQLNCEIVLYSITDENNLNGYFHSIPLSRRVDGLILVALNVSEEEMAYLHQTGLPVVSIEQPLSMFSSIECDNYYAGGLAADCFVKKRQLPCGYIGTLTDEPYSIDLKNQRLEGFRLALEKAGHPMRPEHILLGEPTVEDAEKLAYEMLTLPERPRAIFAYSDVMAFGVLNVARQLKLRIPEDLAVMGFDDIEAAKYMNLSTVNQSLFESGRIAARLLMDKIKEADQPNQKISLVPSIVERGTT